MRFVDREFVDADINMDGNEFVRCRFDGCTIRYSGGSFPLIADCAFVNVQFQFDHSAGRTLKLLGALNRAGAINLSETIPSL